MNSVFTHYFLTPYLLIKHMCFNLIDCWNNFIELNEVAYDSYIEHFIKHDNEQLANILKEQSKRMDIQPCVGLQAGKLLGLLIRTIQGKSILEFGTCIGYSTIWIAQALKETGGKLIATEYNQDLLNEAKKNIEEAGLSDYVEFILGDANEVINHLEGPFDMILQDSDKSLYPQMLERCINLLRKDGLLIADDVLFKPMGLPEKFSEPVDQYLKKVFVHPNKSNKTSKAILIDNQRV
ncbi:MAG: O-methyltransferase [Cellulosilyticaceae bacterium]